MFRFDAEVWLWEGDAAWHFLTVPPDVSDEIHGRTAVAERRGFGSVRVRVSIGSSTWSTSVFPNAKGEGYVLPVKKAVRAAESFGIGDRVDVVLELLDG